MFYETIIKWLIPFLCGGLVTAILALFKRQKALETGVQCLLRAEIIRSHEKYTERGSIPIYAEEAVARAYHSYHQLGGNDVATELYEEIKNLPIEHKKKE